MRCILYVIATIQGNTHACSILRASRASCIIQNIQNQYSLSLVAVYILTIEGLNQLQLMAAIKKRFSFKRDKINDSVPDSSFTDGPANTTQQKSPQRNKHFDVCTQSPKSCSQNCQLYNNIQDYYSYVYNQVLLRVLTMSKLIQEHNIFSYSYFGR